MYVYPYLNADGKIVTAQTLGINPDLSKLYGYLLERGFIQQMDNYKPEYLPIFSRDVLQKIKIGDDSWKAMVPENVSEIIQKRCFFGYRPK